MLIHPLSDELIVKTADALAGDGIIVLPQALGPQDVAPMRRRALQLAAAGALKAAGIGRLATAQHAPAIRGDAIAWLDAASADETDQATLHWLEALRQALNEQLFLGIEALEAHYAVYPPGAGYARHLDCHRDSDARVISMVLYLNETWQPAWGGQLQIVEEERIVHTIEPQGGTLVLFRSERFPHEVLAALQQRVSIAGWFRRRTL
jgi:SM-20-related protein